MDREIFKVRVPTKKLRNSDYFNFILPRNYSDVWLKSVVKQISETVKPYGITIWHESKSNEVTANFVIREFSKHLPTIQFGSSAKFLRTRTVIPELVIHPRGSLNILLINNQKPEILEHRINDTLYNQVQNLTAANSPLPKVLVVILGLSGLKSSSLLETNIKRLTIGGWEKKFLDLTFVCVDKYRKSKAKMLLYDIFDKKLVSREKLFPNKLKNMKNYPFIMAYDESNKKRALQELKKHELNDQDLSEASFLHLKNHFCRLRNCTAVIMQGHCLTSILNLIKKNLFPHVEVNDMA